MLAPSLLLCLLSSFKSQASSLHWGSFACIHCGSHQLRWQSVFCLAASLSLESNCVSCCHRRAGRSCCCPKTSARLPLQSPLPLSSSPPYRFTFLFSSVSCFMIPPHKLTKSCRRHAIARAGQQFLPMTENGIQCEPALAAAADIPQLLAAALSCYSCNCRENHSLD